MARNLQRILATFNKMCYANTAMVSYGGKFMWSKKRYHIVTAILRPIFTVYYYLQFRCRVKKEKLPDEGAVIIANHVTTLDPVLIGLKFDKPIFYMTSKHIFQNRWIGKLLKFLVNPIPKEKINKSDIAAIKTCMQIAKEDGSICIFAEGNRTFTGKLGYVDPAIIKLVKRLGKPLIVCNILGGYGSEPRWCNGLRKGKMEVTVKRVYTVEQMSLLSNDALYEQVICDMTVDEFPSTISFKGKRRAECLESILHICPVCGREHTIYSKKHEVCCSGCGNRVTYEENLTLSCANDAFPFRYIHEWYDFQIQRLMEKEYSPDEAVYHDEIALYQPQMWKKKQMIGCGTILLYGSSLCFSLDSGKISLPFDDIQGITLIGNRIMDVYSGDQTYRVMGEHATNLIKYMHTFYIINNRRKGITNGFIGI